MSDSGQKLALSPAVEPVSSGIVYQTLDTSFRLRNECAAG